MYKKFITTKTPLRISFLGGGTDMSNFYKKTMGQVISCSINKFVYVTVKEHGKFFFRNFRLNYSKTENKSDINKIQNDIIRETLKIFKIDRPLYISSISDIPSNTGLGSSSAFTVGLIKALFEFKGMKVTNYEIAELACEIEINKVKSPIGKQDQYATALGGFNLLEFNKDESVNVIKLNKNNIIKKILKNSVLVWVGGSRKASSILRDQNLRINSNFKNLTTLANLTSDLSKLIINNKFSLEDFGKFINMNWHIKKSLSNKISNYKIQKLYSSAIKYGSLGGKLLGAGESGFLFLIVKDKEIDTFKQKMQLMNNKIHFEKFNFVNCGSKTLISL